MTEQRVTPKAEWKMMVSRAWLERAKERPAIEAYVARMAKLINGMQPNLFPYFTIGEVLQKTAPEVANVAYQMHVRQPDVSGRTLKIAKIALSRHEKGCGREYSAAKCKTADISDIVE